MDYREQIIEALSGCDVMLAVIGPIWSTVKDKEGNRRLNNAGDWVRLEIETALSRDIPVIPLLVKGANRPKEHELPEKIKTLVYRNGTEIRLNDPDFGKDMGWLIGRIEKSMGNTENRQSLSNKSVSSQCEAPDSMKLLGYLEKLNSAQFNRIIFILGEKNLIDESLLSRSTAQSTNAIEMIKFLKQKSDGLAQLQNVLKDIFPEIS